MKIFSYRTALFLYILLFCLLTFSYWSNGEVVAPHRQFSELAAPDSTGATQLENRKFSDFTNGYIPEISAHLKGSRSSWLTLWTNQNELGRPIYHISGFSPAYLPSWIIAQLTDSPWRFITALSLFTCFFSGIFIILFCREIGLSPLASLIAGVSLAASPLFMYWLTFPMFPAVWCWSAGALWGVTRLARKPDLVGWGVLTFSAYSLLMTAYPQPVVFNAYILGGYGLYLAYRKRKFGALVAVRFVAISSTALIVGAALALPVYIDLAKIATESARVTPDPSFFTDVLPRFGTLIENLRFFVLGTAPELFGNPIESGFPLPYDGLSVTPVVVFFSVIGLLVSFRKTWGWWMAIVVLCLFAFVHPLYVLGVKYLGFNLSRSTPLGSIMLPLTIIVAYGADALVKRTKPGELKREVWFATASVLTVIVIALGFGLTHVISIRWGMFIAMLILVGLLTAQVSKTHPVLLITALVMVLTIISYPLMLRQELAEIATTSPLVEKLRVNLPDGSRFAVAAPSLLVLPPNINAELGLASVHSYNSLSSRRYHTLIMALGGETQTYGRWNGAISPDYNNPIFWMSNISVMFSSTKLMNENLEYLGHESGVYLYKVISSMGESLQVTPKTIAVADAMDLEDPRFLTRNTPTKVLDKGDLLEFKVVPRAHSVLILSQKFHPDWQAKHSVRPAG